MTYTSVSRVRGLFGFSEKDIDDTPLEEMIAYVDKEVDLATGTTWDGTETYYPIAQEAAAILVGSLIYKRFPDKQALSKHLWDEGKGKLEEISGIPFKSHTEAIE